MTAAQCSFPALSVIACLSAAASLSGLIEHIFMQASAEETAGKLKEDNKWHIFCTGHSMGGALANLCAHELAVSPILGNA